MEIFKNKVEAANQLSNHFYMEGDNEAKFKIMFIGNSITIHEIKEEIGWTRFCGMAASDLQHDYVHLVYKYFVLKHGNVSMCVYNGGFWELDFTNKEKADSIASQVEKYKPDIVIMRIGENINRNLIQQGLDPYEGFDYLIKQIKQLTKNLIVTSLFWKYDLLDARILKASQDNNVKYVYLTDLSSDKSNEAIGQFESISVSLHPNDKGMKEIANRIIKALEEF